MLVERYGQTLRHGGMAVTCEPDAVGAVLMERPNVATRSAERRGTWPDRFADEADREHEPRND